MPNMADYFHGEIISHHVDLMRYGETVRASVLANLQALADDLEGKLRAADMGQRGMTAFSRKRLETLLAQTRKSISTAYSSNAKQLTGDLKEVASLTEVKTRKTLAVALQGAVQTTSLPPAAIVRIASDTLIQGAPSKDWWAKQSRELQDRFAAQLRIGLLAGETNDQLVQRIRGTATGRRNVVEVNGKTRVLREFAGGVMAASTRDATALVRTSVQAVANATLWETYNANDSVVKGVQVIATLDLRTTPGCRAKDGGMWGFDGDPLPDSPVQTPFPGRPPYHWQCRTTILPLTFSWAELVEKSGNKKGIDTKALHELSPSTRASMDGQVAQAETYEGWLKKQSVDRQKEVLGPGRWELWTQGKLGLQDMVDFAGNPLTLAQLQAKILDKAEQARLAAEKAAAEARRQAEALEKAKRDAEEAARKAQEAAAKQDERPPHQQYLDAMRKMEAEAEQAGLDYQRLIEDLLVESDAYMDALWDKKFDGKISEAEYYRERDRYKDEVRAKRWGEAEFRKKQARMQEAEQFLADYPKQRSELLFTLFGADPDEQILIRRVDGSCDEHVRGRIRQAAEFAQRLTGGGHELQIHFTSQQGVRANYRKGAAFGFITLDNNDPVSVAVHEIGHGLEYQIPGMKQKMNDFLNRRCEGQVPKFLAALYPGHGYEDHEISIPDKFLDAYIGKQYGDGATEVMSMGLQYLYTSPEHFARNDPDMFDTIINALKGR